MECIVCHGEDISAARVQEQLQHSDDIVIVPVEIPVCGTCGERYYDRKTLRFLEETEEKLRTQQPPLQEVGRILTLP